MNHHAPPGGWEPREPAFMAEFRKLEATIAYQVERYIRARRRDFVIWFVAGVSGYWFGFASVELLKWWAGIR